MLYNRKTSTGRDDETFDADSYNIVRNQNCALNNGATQHLIALVGEVGDQLIKRVI